MEAGTFRIFPNFTFGVNRPVIVEKTTSCALSHLEPLWQGPNIIIRVFFGIKPIQAHGQRAALRQTPTGIETFWEFIKESTMISTSNFVSVVEQLSTIVENVNSG